MGHRIYNVLKKNILKRKMVRVGFMCSTVYTDRLGARSLLAMCTRAEERTGQEGWVDVKGVAKNMEGRKT